MLQKLTKKEIIVTGEMEDDRINTFLELNDYDWMSYSLKSIISSKLQGVLGITFNFYGSVDSEMLITQCDLKTAQLTSYRYIYDTDIFQKYIVRFLSKHIGAWDDDYTFYGGNIVIDWFNEVLEKHLECVPCETDFTKVSRLRYLQSALEKESYDLFRIVTLKDRDIEIQYDYITKKYVAIFNRRKSVGDTEEEAIKELEKNYGNVIWK